MLTRMNIVLRRFGKDKAGVTSIEYALVALFIAVAIVTAVILVSPRLAAIFAAVATAI